MNDLITDIKSLELETIKNEDDLESVWLICRNSPRAETKIYTETLCEDHFLNSKFKNKNVFKLLDIQLTHYKN